MPQYKLTYFDLAAAAEPIRWAFKVAGVEFEDERINPADWPTLKKSGRFPGETLALLEIDGEVFTQNMAILRYVGNKFGLSVDDELTRLRLDQAIDIMADTKPFFRAWLLETDPEKKKKAGEVLVTEGIPLCLRQLTPILAKNKGPFIAGQKLTYADLLLVCTLNTWLTFGHTNAETLQKDCPALLKLKEAVENVPQIKAWLAVRPKTRF